MNNSEAIHELEVLYAWLKRRYDSADASSEEFPVTLKNKASWGRRIEAVDLGIQALKVGKEVVVTTPDEGNALREYEAHESHDDPNMNPDCPFCWSKR